MTVEERKESGNLIARADALERARAIVEAAPPERFHDASERRLAVDLVKEAAEEAAEVVRRYRASLD